MDIKMKRIFETVSRIIEKFKTRKNPELDIITAEMLKNTSDLITALLTHIFNCCFEEGIFPNILKTSVIKPLSESGDRQEVISYTPISLISNIAKISEKLIKERVTDFSNKCSMLSERQYRFRGGSSAEYAIFTLLT